MKLTILHQLFNVISESLKRFQCYLVFCIITVDLKNLTQYRDEFIGKFFLSYVIKFLIAWLTWKQIWRMQSSPVIAGYSYNQLLEYYLVVPLVLLSCQLSEQSDIAEEIYQGTFNRYLLFPVSFFYLRFISHLANTFVYLLLIVLLSAYLNPKARFLDLAITFQSLLVAVAITFLIETIAQFMAFWFEHSDGLLSFIRFIYGISAGAYIPISFFDEYYQSMLFYTPFPAIIDTPIKAITGRLTKEIWFQLLWVEMFWVSALSLLTFLVWKNGLKHYNAEGN